MKLIKIMEQADIKNQRIADAVRRRKRQLFLRIGGVVVMLIVAGYGIFAYLKNRDVNLPGALISDLGREHIAQNHQHAYNSNPPTSGWHYPQEAEWGAYREELPDETLIHNLEHGGIWISYKPDISEEMRANLEEFYKQWGRKIIVTPRSKNDADIAVAAWTRLDKFGAAEYSEERIEKFVRAYRNKGPEFVP